MAALASSLLRCLTSATQPVTVETISWAAVFVFRAFFLRFRTRASSRLTTFIFVMLFIACNSWAKPAPAKGVSRRRNQRFFKLRRLDYEFDGRVVRKMNDRTPSADRVRLLGTAGKCDNVAEMGWFEAAIIYLALGAPVAVHRATGMRGSLSARDVLDVGLSFLGWPVALGIFAWRRVYSSETERDERLRARIDELANRLQADIPVDVAEASGFEETLGRYVDLSLAVEHPEGPPKELFALSGHPDAELAARCGTRRESKKLVFHQLRARNDLLALIDRLVRVSTDRAATLRTSIAIVELLGDVDAAADLAVMDPGGDASRNDLRKPSVAAARR